MSGLCDECKEMYERFQDVNNDILELSCDERERLKSIVYYQRRDEIGINCINCIGRYSEDIAEKVLYV